MERTNNYLKAISEHDEITASGTSWLTLLKDRGDMSESKAHLANSSTILSLLQLLVSEHLSENAARVLCRQGLFTRFSVAQCCSNLALAFSVPDNHPILAAV